jgi:hypothetical protein
MDYASGGFVGSSGAMDSAHCGVEGRKICQVQIRAANHEISATIHAELQ